MIMDFHYYLENNLVRKGSQNKAEAQALIEKADARLEFSIKTRKINEKTASFIFEDIYECMREASQSLMALKGYKPYSHEALIAFLKEFFNFSESDINNLNKYRILRNKTVYGGEKISQEKCKEALNFLIVFLKRIKGKYKLEQKIR